MPAGRVLVAFDDDWNVVSPTWTRLDADPRVGPAAYRVAGITIDRGRQSELDKTDAGTAQVVIMDRSGDFDPTWSGGAFYNKMNSNLQIMLQIHDPVTDTWYTRFRGFIEKWTYQLYPMMNLLTVTIDCHDLLAVAARAELIAGQHGVLPAPTINTGNVYYAETSGVNAVGQRINDILDDMGWNSTMREVFTGNVQAQAAVYASRNQFLTAIDDTCDAEFPGVSNRWVRRDGYFVFHGRLARFYPNVARYNINKWKAGDAAAVLADSNYVPLAGGEQDAAFEFVRDEEDIVNMAYAAPKGIALADKAGQYTQDAASILKYGPHSWSAEDLLTLHDELSGDDQLGATLAFAQYYVDNKKDQQTRLPQAAFSIKHPDDPRAAKTYQLLGQIDISDMLTIKTTHSWGGGFDNVDFFIEGCHEVITPAAGDDYDDIRLTVDLSPAIFYANPETGWVEPA